MKIVYIVIFSLITLTSFGQGVNREMNDSKTNNYVVINNGDEFVFDNRGMNSTSSMGTFDNKSGSMIVNGSNAKGAFFRFNRYLWVNPYATYKINYKVKSASSADHNLRIGAILFTNSRKEIVTRSKEVVSKNQSGENSWRDETIIFQTTFDTRYIRLVLFNEVQSDLNCEFKDVKITQISQHKELSISNEILSSSKLSSGKSLTVPVSGEYRHFRINLNLSNPNLKDNPEIIFKWYSQGKVVAANYCHVTRLKGIEEEWNGIRVQWYRNWDYSTTKKISTKAEHIFHGNSQLTQFDGVLPENCDLVTVEAKDIDLAGLKILAFKTDYGGRIVNIRKTGKKEEE